MRKDGVKSSRIHNVSIEREREKKRRRSVEIVETVCSEING